MPEGQYALMDSGSIQYCRNEGTGGAILPLVRSFSKAQPPPLSYILLPAHILSINNAGGLSLYSARFTYAALAAERCDSSILPFVVVLYGISGKYGSDGWYERERKTMTTPSCGRRQISGNSI